MRILLISDGTFLARHTARRLLDLGHIVTDVRPEGFVLPDASASTLEETGAGPIELEGCDRVLCLVGARTLASDALPSPMMSLITRATEFAQLHSARFVLASAMPRTASKGGAVLGVEQQVARAICRHGLDAGVCRVEGLYGGYAETTEYHGLLGPLISAGIASTPLQTAAPWDALHWPLHVRDAVDGIVRMLERRGTGRVRLAGAVPYRTRDMLATVEAVLGVAMSLTTDHLDERRSTHPPHIGDARRLLRWRPRVGLFAGVEEQAFREATRVER